MKAVVERWKSAVVHLECAGDSEPLEAAIKKIKDQSAGFDRGEIAVDELMANSGKGSRDVRSQGTALFLIHEGRRYLLTARHVVFDPLDAKREIDDDARRNMFQSEEQRSISSPYAKRNAADCISKIIFRVSSLNEVVAGGRGNAFLMNLKAGHAESRPYVFTGEDLDLALISLDRNDARFADELLVRGFSPIDFSYVDAGPLYEGQDVFTVGFPGPTAPIGTMNLSLPERNWASETCSLPVSSFGKVAMTHDLLNYFWADMSIYPGNSGGPTIADGRLVGVVVGNAKLAIDQVPDVWTRIPFAKVIKTGPVFAMLEELIRRDKPYLGY
ncbi:S1 family peptidase [Nevskia ramosa]|uniref:S1 family peptidase n=1 Tax=Nevskia ramosa TaxID=64002 RepID=UPI003D148B0A